MVKTLRGITVLQNVYGGVLRPRGVSTATTSPLGVAVKLEGVLISR